LFATIITLILVPALYNIFADFMPDTHRSVDAQAQPA